MATIDIRAELPDGAPAVAEVSFAVMDTKGNIFGVHLEMDPDSLLRSSQTGWAVSLDHEPSTKPGFGVFSYASNPNVAPSVASKGTLNGKLRGKLLEGSFSSNADGFATGTFGGSYLVRCWTVSTGATLAEKPESIGGNLSSGYAMVEDSNFSTPFCSRFGDL